MLPMQRLTGSKFSEATPGYVGPDRVYTPGFPRRFIYRPGGGSPRTHRTRRVLPGGKPGKRRTPQPSVDPAGTPSTAPAHRAHAVPRTAQPRSRRATRPMPLRARQRAGVRRSAATAIFRSFRPVTGNRWGYNQPSNPESGSTPLKSAAGPGYIRRTMEPFDLFLHGRRL